MSYPIVSVIIPFYNVEKYVTETIQSVLTQSCSNIEIICVDDKSTDDTFLKLLQFKSNENVKIVQHDFNQGPGAARNTGVEISSGKFLFFLDGDDILADNALKNLTKMAELTNSDICSGQVRSFTECNHHDIHYNLKNVNGLYSFHGKKRYLLGRCYATSSRLYLRSFFCANIKKFPIGVSWEDVVPFVTGQVTAQRASFIDDVVILYRKREGSLTTKQTNFNDVKIYLEEVHEILSIHNKKCYRMDFLFFCANAYTWLPASPELKECFISVISSFGYTEKDFKKSAALKRLRNIYGSPYTILDRLRTKINKFRWYYLDK